MKIYFSASTLGFYSDDIHASMPADVVEITAQQRDALLYAEASGGKLLAADVNGQPIAVDRPGPTAERVQEMLTALVQRHLDAQARALGYDDIKSAVTYADEPSVVKFQSEGRALRAWRSSVWQACIEILDQVKAGARDVPSAAELIAALPPLTAP
jgi:hypothetical protein